jgi:hypothetical protein
VPSWGPTPRRDWVERRRTARSLLPAAPENRRKGARPLLLRAD